MPFYCMLAEAVVLALSPCKTTAASSSPSRPSSLLSRCFTAKILHAKPSHERRALHPAQATGSVVPTQAEPAAGRGRDGGWLERIVAPVFLGRSSSGDTANSGKHSLRAREAWAGRGGPGTAVHSTRDADQVGPPRAESAFLGLLEIG